jgi:hypothetical protein
MIRKKNTPVVIPSISALPKLLTVKEVAHFLNANVRTVQTIIKAKQLTHSRAVAA